MPHQIRILHISDLHAKAESPFETWRQRRVLGQAWKDNLAAIKNDGVPFDLICFTGDVSFSGQGKQFEDVDVFVGELLAALDLPRGRLFCVPGNHDIDRTVEPELFKRFRRLSNENANALSQWLAGGETPEGFKREDLDLLLGRQKEYRTWLVTSDASERLPGASAHGRLGYRNVVRIERLPFDIHVIGLDSSWLSGDENDRGRLLLTDDQILRLARDEAGAPLAGFRLALLHHPLDWLVDAASAARNLADNVDLHLRGHLHDPAAELKQDPDRSLWSLAAGCLYDGEKYPNSIQVIDIALDGDGRPLRYDLCFRCWSARGHWHNDNSLYAKSVDGRLTWQVTAGGACVTETSIHQRVGSLFIGRETELGEMHAALVEPAKDRLPIVVCAVQGMPGVGKSYLVDRFVHLHRSCFPGGVLRLAFASSIDRSAESLRDELCERLGVRVGAGSDQATSSKTLVAALLRRLKSPLSLVIVENVDDHSSAGAVASLAAMLPGIGLLVTGRWTALGETADWVQVCVRPLEANDALALLRGELHSECLPTGIELSRLARELGFLPLALHLAAGYINHGYSVTDYLTELRRTGFRLPPADRADPLLRGEEARAIIEATFALSLKALARLGPKNSASFAGAFAAFGYAAPEGFGRSLGIALSEVSDENFPRLVRAASQLSLMEIGRRDEGSRAVYRIHPLLSEVLRSKCKRWRVLGALSGWFDSRLVAPSMAGQGVLADLRSELRAEAATLGLWLSLLSDVEFAKRAINAADYALGNGPYSMWIDRCEVAIRGAQSDPGLLGPLFLVAQLLISAGQLEPALSAADRLVAVANRSANPHMVAVAMGFCADVLHSRLQLADALRIRQEVLPILKTTGDIHSYAVTIGKIADVLHARGQLDEELRMRLEEELPIYERRKDIRSRAVCMGKIADIHQARSHYDEALRIHREVELPAYEQCGDTRELAITMSRSADALVGLGQPDEALRMLREQVLPIYEQLNDNRLRAVAIGRIAGILESNGKYDEALKIRQEVHIPALAQIEDGRELVVAQMNLAALLLRRMEAGDLEEADRLLRQAYPVATRLRIPEAQTITKIRESVGLARM